MSFKREEVADLLAKCHRRCCICQRYCGVKIETDHIKPQTEGGDDSIDNAIPVCFDCHAEIHSYNNEHPRGRKFTAQELLKHKEQWLTLCKTMPEKILMQSRVGDTEVGPLQALIDEIDYNLEAAELTVNNVLGCPFRTQQFDRAIHTGSISLLAPTLKTAIIKAYAAVGIAHYATLAQTKAMAEEVFQPNVTKMYGACHQGAECLRLLKEAQTQLVNFLQG
ncbi:MAG TPA: HNH endonuclease [Gemmatales bacterium]|nr:HNH endonuclease [Gemmatales bacterium]